MMMMMMPLFAANLDLGDDDDDDGDVMAGRHYDRLNDLYNTVIVLKCASIKMWETFNRAGDVDDREG